MCVDVFVGVKVGVSVKVGVVVGVFVGVCVGVGVGVKVGVLRSPSELMRVLIQRLLVLKQKEPLPEPFDHLRM